MDHSTKAFLANKWNNSVCYSRLGRTPYYCSRIGFGSYRVSHEIEDHAKALRQAIDAGFNLIDTSANYANGGSEKLIGRVLKDQDVNRDSLVIVSKVGYIQGDNYDLARMREKKGSPYGEVVKYGPNIWHCIHPEFIQDQLELSLGRLDLASLDFYLLHNPEYYFLDLMSHSDKHDIEKAQFTFYDRIRRAFVALEELVEQGKIKYYGISSNTLALPTADYSAVHLPTLLGIAEEIANDKHGDRNAHHFAMVQCPLNILENQALALEQNDGQTSLLKFANDHKLAVLTNRALNAQHNGTLLRLASYDIKHKEPNISQQLSLVSRLEKEFVADFAQHIQPIIDKHGTAFKIGEQLQLADMEKISSIQWQDFTGTYLIREVVNLVKSFDNVFREKVEVNNSWSVWKSKYLDALGELIEHVLSHARTRENLITDQLNQSLAHHGMENIAEFGLSQKALLAVACLQEVSCTLLGMRQPSYVDDAKKALSAVNSVDEAKVRSWFKKDRNLQ